MTNTEAASWKPVIGKVFIINAMTLRFTAAAVLLLMAFACGGSTPATADLEAGTTNTGSASPGSSNVTGKLAPAIAPPSALIVLEPQGGAELPVKTEPAIMDQAGYEFLPGFLLAQAGQSVQFRNSEDVLHNVRVTEISTQKPVFNVATVAFGKYEHKFEPGYYNVTCDIHTTMRASILVTASPYTASTAEDGTFRISNVRPGQYNLTIYAGPAPVVRPIDVKSGRTDLGEIH
jgi:plastocyanin